MTEGQISWCPAAGWLVRPGLTRSGGRLPSTPGRSDRGFVLAVEEMQALGIDRELQLFIHLCGMGWFDRGDHRHRADRDIQEDLRAEPLDDLDHRAEVQLGGI